MTTSVISPQEALKKYFGFNQFKGEQEEIILSLLNGQDTFVIMPTGGGKSLCYQLPALMQEGVAIVVSPLIALMKNQVDAVRGYSANNDVAHFLNSSLNKTEAARVREAVTNGSCKMRYVAPESLTKAENVEFLRNVKVSFVAIDEAHCISEWGHDFRPEYRRIKAIVEEIADVPIIALTATATPKVQQDIQKNLGMVNAKVFKASFNRPNLYYEVQPKKDVLKQMVQFIKKHEGKSGIIYCLSRKKVEELAESLRVNGINAKAYHAGMDANHRARVQDEFLMQDVDVIVATIAFGMGIDKPDVRFVLHHDMPKSLESYYQETGRAGRDGGEGICISYYSYKDIEKLEKFLQGKPIAEQEIGMQLLQEVMAYAETSMSRRKFILHYFGEEFDEVNGPGAELDDNTRYPKEKIEGKEEVKMLLQLVQEQKEKFKAKYIVNVLCGIKNAEVDTYRGAQSAFWENGKEQGVKFWHAVARQCVVHQLLRKEVESYGTLKLTSEGKQFIETPTSFQLLKEVEFDVEDTPIDRSSRSGGGAADQVLFNMLKDLRKKVSKEKNVPPFVVFQDPSLEEMATSYPICRDELCMIGGVGQGKAIKFGTPFINLIQRYVDDNGIERTQDMMVKSIVNKSGNKVNIIQNIDRKLPLEDIASSLSIQLEALITQLETIVASGTKININYYLDDLIDEDSQEEIFDYFMEAETDSIADALEEFEDDFTEDEIRLMRLKFMSEVAN
ncbi:MAG: DNA helicase RecQ [Flavobacteriales bacterium]|nr:DNA helicase RecQ [Flavobacteriales bacterium]